MCDRDKSEYGNEEGDSPFLRFCGYVMFRRKETFKAVGGGRKVKGEREREEEKLREREREKGQIGTIQIIRDTLGEGNSLF